MRTITRRQFAFSAAAAAAGFAMFDRRSSLAQSGRIADARLAVRPPTGIRTTLASGPLGLSSGERDGVVQIPTGVAPETPLPLLVFLHGATQNGARMLARIGPAAERTGVAVLAPDSRSGTWDAIRDSFGEDVAFLNRALAHVLGAVNVDPERIAIGGFSDGASYGLSLGLANGDLFQKVLACSPGFVIQAPAHGKPRVFVSHGTADQILPIDRCSRVIVPRLRAMRYDVTFREFEGRHEIPPAVAAEAFAWLGRS
jgi:phospholipase/carboxylesterase